MRVSQTASLPVKFRSKLIDEHKKGDNEDGRKPHRGRNQDADYNRPASSGYPVVHGRFRAMHGFRFRLNNVGAPKEAILSWV